MGLKNLDARTLLNINMLFRWSGVHWRGRGVSCMGHFAARSLLLLLVYISHTGESR
jgi:hypothetical protein